jgi:hypothetical protein
MLVANMNKMHRGLGLEARTPFAEALDELIASAGRLTGDTNRLG